MRTIPEVRKTKVRDWNEVYQVVAEDVRNGRLKVGGEGGYTRAEAEAFKKTVNGKLDAMSARLDALARTVEAAADLPKSGRK